MSSPRVALSLESDSAIREKGKSAPLICRKLRNASKLFGHAHMVRTEPPKLFALDERAAGAAYM